jgi:hypothetical protein
MSKVFTIEIPQEVANYLNGLAVSVASRMECLKSLFVDRPDDENLLDSASFKYYHDEYVKKKVEYDLGVNDLQKHCPAGYKALNWKAEFSTCELSIVAEELKPENKYEVEADPEFVAEIMSLDYLATSMKSLVSDIIGSEIQSTTIFESAAFQAYHKKLDETLNEFHKLRDEVETRYKDDSKGKAKSFNLVYADNKVIFYL